MNCVTDKASLDDENVWDDALLIKAYDSSLKLAKEELARRIAQSTNGKKIPSRPVRNAAATAEPSAFPSNSKQSEEENPSFKIGDYARATYDDGVDYEAKILSIDGEQGMCRLRYIGYENEQDVRVCDLVPSWGKKARRMQFTRAKQEYEFNDEQNGQDDKKNKSTFPTISQFNGIPHGAVPLPPAMPPMFAQGEFEDSEHLSAMLISWYMSGYYTGIYQGMQMAKMKPKSKK